MEALNIVWQMWVTFGVIAFAVIAYSSDRFSLELVSAITLGTLLVFFHIFPLTGLDGLNMLRAESLLSGFASPALFAILGLLIVGQGMYQSGALDWPTRALIAAHAKLGWIAVVGVFIFVMVVSAFLNNTPVVVMFVPIMAAVAAQSGIAPSRLMMPLSFMSILGGMLTTIGSSTNLLAIEVYRSFSGESVNFFALAPLGLILATIGAGYLAAVTKWFLPDRHGEIDLNPSDGRQFLAQVTLERANPLIGETSKAGLFPSLKNVTVRLIQRRDDILLPPFDDVTLRLHDKVVVAATRDALTRLLKTKSEILSGFLAEVETPEGGGELTMIEAVVAPGSRIIGRTINQIRFRFQTNCVIVGIQRRSRMIRGDIQSIRLEAGDVLLILGDRGDIRRLRADRDILMLERSMTQLPDPDHARYAAAIFIVTVALAATGVLPIAISAICGAAAMVATGCLNIRQAARAIDRRVFLLIGVAIAMGLSMQATGGANYISSLLTPLADRPGGTTLLISAFFILTAALTNVLSNNATAVLLTPIAISAAEVAGIDPKVMLFTVIYAANCSFATPVAYQTNLLVMAPGHYQFRDFVMIGVPLIILLWIVYTLIAPTFFGMLGML